MKIYTRENRNGNFWCNATIEGQDMYFEGTTVESAQGQMRSKLRELKITDFEFTGVVKYSKYGQINHAVTTRLDRKQFKPTT
jgi:hypothetical protein